MAGFRETQGETRAVMQMSEAPDFLAILGRFGYTEGMIGVDKTLTDQEVAEARQRRLMAAHLQALEGNPPTAEDTAMFEMFERERWPHERRLAYIRQQAEDAAMIHAAE